MRMEMKAKRMAAVAAMAIALAGAPRAQAQQAGRLRLPSAREVIEKHIEKTGGREAHSKFKTRVMTGKINLSVMDQTVTGTFARYQSAPNLMYMRLDLGEFGMIETGTDGKVHWELTSMSGARVFSGVEKAIAERDARFYHDLELFDLYEKIEVTGEDTVKGKPCYSLRMTPAIGYADDAYFEKDSGLLAATMTTLPTDIGPLPIWVTFDDYKQVDGLGMPHNLNLVIEDVGQEIEILCEKTDHKVAIPASRYELPPAIKALIGK